MTSRENEADLLEDEDVHKEEPYHLENPDLLDIEKEWNEFVETTIDDQ